VNGWIIGSRKRSNSRLGRQCASMEESSLEMERKRTEVRPTLERILG